MRRNTWFLLVGFLAVGCLGYWLAKTAAPTREAGKPAPAEVNRRVAKAIPYEESPKFRRGERAPVFRMDDEAANAGALTGQRVLVFTDRDALEEFLRRAGDKIQVMGRLDALGALRVGFLNYDDLAGLLSGEEEVSMIFPVDVPTNDQGVAQAGAVPLGASLLEWLGITGDNSTWGAGVRVAILDTGVLAHAAFGGQVHSIDLVGGADPSTQNGHGTAVASFIIGKDPRTPGVAPDATIVSVRIADDFGQSDSFLLAKGIIAAVDSGAQIINISMGSFGDSSLVRNAIDYALASGSLIIAASGNNGQDRVTYPAANQGVIAVGAVDAHGTHLDFSNTGQQLDLTAPGFGLNAAWPGDQAVSVSGTSFSAPIISGAVAAIMSQSPTKVTARQALDLLYSHLNDGGEAGHDTMYGAGMPDIGRVLNANTPGIYDAAVASQRYVEPSSGSPYGAIEVLVQNRGTENLVNTRVDVTTPGGTISSNITFLAPNGVQTVQIPVTRQPAGTSASLRYDSRVTLSTGLADAKPSNDRRVDQYVPAGD